jgi:hypothetical protein
MKIWAVLATALLTAIVIGATPLRAQTGPQGADIRRTVPREAETRVNWSANWSNREGNCTARFYPTLELVAPPAHGAVRFVNADIGIPPHSGCTNAVYGTAVLYRPSPGFVGQDRFTYKVQDDPMAMTHVGPRGSVHTIAVTVQ